ncbi:putative Ecp7(P20) [Drepanopeziza brunnea f. sp. 'multigermtubi' MB_m1]|uniref:LysM26p n=2 Tax=Drepanopeziza brunnea f. sp. 'multigermtubi' TaxID=698441 RepID=J9XN87_9HELO|nr:putative Ecp7(P20) [Drepanopeziza brunnea f. sp. 'multigermtubi' MB_m1]AFS30744.1 LysM26p [Drepanopeziza brunnea f. sp. 'multigermtubi']EKD17421.1 putative Ecp7(P20) [Drepanopeziza brunnea f. sp. 'multigermtubi' MB_m1]
MRFNNNLLLVASFLGVATAYRRTCKPDTTGAVQGLGSYTLTDSDNWSIVAADFCTTLAQVQSLNSSPASEKRETLTVPCRERKRDCARISSSNEFGYYTVVDGDQLSAIASDFCIPVDALQTTNSNVASTITTPGTILKVPCSWN